MRERERERGRKRERGSLTRVALFDSRVVPLSLNEQRVRGDDLQVTRVQRIDAE